MTLATLITPADFATLCDEVFRPEQALVQSAESALGETLETFESADAMQARIAACAARGDENYSFGLWYPTMKGQVSARRIELDPPRDGHTFRHSMSGWGIIRLNLYFTPPNTLQCRISVNSQARALSRESRYPELGPAADWDWQAVETYAFRLSRKLATMGRVAPVGLPSPKPAPAPSPWRRRK